MNDIVDVMMDIMERAVIVLAVLIGVPFLFGVAILVVMAYFSALGWVLMHLQVWWMA